MSNWFDRWHTVTEAMAKHPNRIQNLFCGFCGHDFEVGEQFKPVYTNDIPGAWGNPLSCLDCFGKHGQQVLRKIWVTRWEQIRTKYKWWNVHV